MLIEILYQPFDIFVIGVIAGFTLLLFYCSMRFFNTTYKTLRQKELLKNKIEKIKNEQEWMDVKNEANSFLEKNASYSILSMLNEKAFEIIKNKKDV